MDLFIKIYIKNYKDLFQRTPINPFEKKSLIILIALGFIHIGTSILYIFLKDYMGNFMIIESIIISILVIIIIAINVIFKKKNKDKITEEIFKKNIRLLKSTFEARKIAWTKDNINLLLSECENILNYKDPYFSIIEKFIPVVFIPFFLSITTFLSDAFKLINPIASLWIYILSFMILVVLSYAYPISYSIKYKNNFYLEKIKNTIFDFRLSSEYEEME